MLKEKCSMTDKEWEERQKLRNDELAAVSEAIGILSSDDARDLFTKVYTPPAFVQLAQNPSAAAARRQRVVQLLERVAGETRTGELDAVVASAKLDAFEKVKKAIDDMVTQLLKEKDEEIKNRDLCTKELNTNERTTAKELHEKERTVAKIETLETSIRQLNGTINQLHLDIADLEQQKTVADDNRAKEKAEFDAVIADQKSAEALLQQAYDAVAARYSAQGTALAQQSPPAPEGFKAYEKKGTEANGVLGLLEHIIQNTVQMQKEAAAAEASAQQAYEQFVQDTNASVDAKQNAILDRSKEMSQAEGDLTQAKSELDGTMTELETLSKGLADLRTSCDFLLKNFEVRQTARDQEVEALRQAKAYLSGMQ
mmetsp:Transcript_45751/g.127524  ORF Transcript_45751/g.127524 Transcript_45751/m.127524 type:complete len:370 (+) Transcript_45751:1-1110(+)